MKFQDKLFALRKSNGMSQEELAEKLNVSRQAVSRWEAGSAMPDAGNLLLLSDLFGVSVDYLLRDNQTVTDQPGKRIRPQSGDLGSIFIVLVALEVLAVLLQFISVFVLQNNLFAFLSFLPFVAMIAGFEIVFRRHPRTKEVVVSFRRRFYKVTAWLGLYFPTRLVITTAAGLYPRPYAALVLEGIVLVCYLVLAAGITAALNKKPCG